MVLGILALIFVPKQRTLPQIVARDFRSYQNEKLTLELDTPHVYDLSAKSYPLVGGRVQDLQSRQTEWVVYRGPNNQDSVCQMYVGNVSELPTGSVEREHRGKKFYVYDVKGVTMVFWQDHKVVCVLIFDMPTEVWSSSLSQRRPRRELSLEGFQQSSRKQILKA